MSSRRLAQRRHVDADHRQPAEQIVADAAFLHRAVEAGIDAGHRPDVERDRLAGFDQQRFAIAQHAREPRLHARRRVGDVLQVDRAADGVVQAALAADALEAARAAASP